MDRTRGESIFYRVTGEERGPWWLAGLRGLARGASWPYALGAGLKNNLYDLGLKRPRRLPAPVIGVGNLVVGGTGKTPMVMELAAALKRMGLPAAVLSRGYGGKKKQKICWVSLGEGPSVGAEDAGDEPVLMARRLNIPVAVGADRWEVGRNVLRSCGPRVLICDDLFQHRRLYRDLDLVCMDAAKPLGNGALLPRGPLREPPAGLRRAHAVVLTRAENAEATERTIRWLRSFWGPGPVLACRHRVKRLKDRDGGIVSADDMAGKPVMAFCGLARPQAFARSLGGLGLDVRVVKGFADHHVFEAQELADLWSQARSLGAEALVCSEKDQVRLPLLPGEARIWVAGLSLEFDCGPSALEGLLAWGLKKWGADR